MNKRILILTAGFGEGHNSAARGVRDGLARVAPNQADVELRDLFAEAYGPINEFVRRSYLALVNSAPLAWGIVYRWLDRKIDYDTEFRRFTRLKSHLAPLLERFRPSVVVCSFPAYANVLQEILGPKRSCKCVVVVTDSITINATWYRSPADYFLVANEQSASVLRAVGVAPEKTKVFGFPVSPKFADFTNDRKLPSNNSKPRVLYMIHAATRGAPVQETIAAACPMIINHVVAGQEEGNARLIVETNSGVVALSPREVVAQIERAFANDAKQWREWASNIGKLSQPRAALDIAEFLMSL